MVEIAMIFLWIGVGLLIAAGLRRIEKARAEKLDGDEDDWL